MRFVLLFLFLVAALGVNSQHIRVDEPEFSGTIVYVNDTTGSGVKLEQQVASSKTGFGASNLIPYAGGYVGKSNIKLVVQGCCSPVVVPFGRTAMFIVKPFNNINSIDPNLIVTVFPLKSDKNKRSAIKGSYSLIGGYVDNAANGIPFTAKKYGSSSYLIAVDGLPAGEYGITMSDGSTSTFLFGVK